MNDVFSGAYWNVNGSTLDGNTVGSIGQNADGTYTVTFYYKPGSTSQAKVLPDGTLSVDTFQRLVPAGDGTLIDCIGVKLGKHIFWDSGEHWVG